MITINETNGLLEIKIPKGDTLMYLTYEEADELYKLLLKRVIKESMKDVTNG